MHHGQMQAGTTQFIQASRVIGMEVRSDNQQQLGKIEDLAIDRNTGKVRYAVLSFGGVMGVGGKLLPLPWNALRTVSKPAAMAGAVPETYCLLNVGKDELQKGAQLPAGPVARLQQPEMDGGRR